VQLTLIVLFCQSDGLLPSDAMTGHNLERENTPRPLLFKVCQPWIPVLYKLPFVTSVHSHLCNSCSSTVGRQAAKAKAFHVSNVTTAFMKEMNILGNKVMFLLFNMMYRRWLNHIHCQSNNYVYFLKINY